MQPALCAVKAKHTLLLVTDRPPDPVLEHVVLLILIGVTGAIHAKEAGPGF